MSNIGCDVDGVLADFHTAFIARVVKETGRDLFGPEFVIRTWNYPDTVGYTKDEVTAVWNSIKADDRFWQRLPPYETTTDDMAALVEAEARGHDIYFVTNRMGVRAKLQTQRWLRRHGFQDPTVILSAHKGLTARALELYFYIDDKWENCLDVSSFARTGVYVFDRTWNQATALTDAENDLYRVTSVRQAFDRFFETI
jgi:FMN phosphatase YigB (HAD superfamily)